MVLSPAAAERSKNERGGGGEGGRLGVFDKEYQSAPFNCRADRLSAFCASRAKMSAIPTRHEKTTLLVTKGDNGHIRTLRAITYKKILNKLNAILAACLHLRATFGLECRAFACKKNNIYKKWGGGGGAAPPFSKVTPCPSPFAAYGCETLLNFRIKLDQETNFSFEY